MKIIRKSSLPNLKSNSFSDAFIEDTTIQKDSGNITKYKWSKYNIVENFNEDIIVYNIASDGVGLFQKDELPISFDTKNIDTFEGNKKFISDLVQIGAVVPKVIDEDLVLSIVRQNQIIQPDKELKIAINTTYACNARCDYCFECGAAHEKMSDKIADEVADYICKVIDEDTLLTYRWFGGEPLLSWDIIDRIINRVNSNFNNKLNYRSVILTNGTVYNKTILDKMYNEWHVYELHVTLDGEKERHNKKKNFVNKELDGYSLVMKLIQTMLKNNIIVACRINVDRQNLGSFEKIVEEFDSFPNKHLLNVYAAPTRRHTKASEDYCFDYSEYESVFDEIYNILYKHNVIASPERLMPARKVTCCSTRAINELVVDTQGNFFKCMQTSTNDQVSVGNCKDGLILNEELSQWLLPKTPPECEDCIYMPICQGGCKGFRSLNNPLVSPCVIEKFYLKTILKYVYILSKEI